MYGGIKTSLCPKCKRQVSNNNFKRHVEACDGTYFTGPHKPRQLRSDEEKLEITQNRIKNLANARQKLVGKPAWNKAKTKETDINVAKYAETLKNEYRLGNILAKGAVNLSADQLSINAKKNGLGGYQPNAGRSKKFKVFDSFGKQVVLQSSYELKCAEILDDLGIKWIRPKSLLYDNKRYFADFYLVDFGIFLDPKNSYKAVIDADKIAKVCEQNQVIVYIVLKENLTHSWFCNLIGKIGD